MNLKNDSHRMMRIMWGDTPKGRVRAYIWLKENVGYDVHFSTSSEQSIRKAHRLLYDRMVRKGFDYMETKPLETMSPMSKPVKIKQKKINIKAPNLRELQRNIKQPEKKLTVWGYIVRYFKKYETRS